MPTPEVLDQIARLGAIGLTLLAIWGFTTGRIRVGTLVDKERDRIIAERAERERELTRERDEWRGRSLSTDQRLDRISQALDRLLRQSE